MTISYNFKTNIPQYIPKEDKITSLKDCVNIKKATKLFNNIDATEGISEDEKTFLKLASTRHYKFNYSKIADYYTSASKEMQELMEDSALVLIDFDDAIAKGYVKLNKKITDLIAKGGNNTNEE